MPNRAELPESRSRLVALALTVLLASAPAATRADRTGDLLRELEVLRAERMELELALERLKRQVPMAAELEHLEARVRRAAEVAELAVEFRPLDDGPIPPLPDGSPGPLRLDGVELSGRGELHRIGALLAMLAVDDLRLRDLESLVVEADGDAHRFVAHLRYPTWTGARSPATVGGGPLDAGVAQARADVALLDAQRIVLESWSARTAAGRLAAATSLLDALDDLPATAVTRVRLDDRVEVAGATLGAAAREALDTSLADFGFTVATASPAGGGACRPFALALGLDGERAADFAAAGAAPAVDERAAQLCAFDPGPAVGRVAARGDVARPGAFALHARGLELVDLFRLLHETTGAGFAVDPDVAGRVDADFEGASLDEALAALAPLGLHFGPDPIRRVSRQPVTAREDDWTGEPATLAFKRLELASLLCLFDRAFSLPSRVAPDLAAEVSIFASDTPWDLALVRSIESAGLDDAIVDGIAHVAPPERLAKVAETPWIPSCEVASKPGNPLESHPQRLAELGADDLTLVATTGSDDSRRAWAYGAFGRIHSLEKGTELHGATVEAIELDAVRVRGSDGRTERLAFTP